MPFSGPPEAEGRGAESKEEKESAELMPYGELLGQVGDQVSKVVKSLEQERDLAAEVRKVGGKVTRETADRIKDLERQKNDLLKVYEKTLEPARKSSWLAGLEGEELLVDKPEDIEALMTDPDEMEVADDELIEVQTSEELKALETKLQDEADKVREEMVAVIEKMHGLKNDEGPAIPDLGDPGVRKAYYGVLEARYNELKDRLTVMEDEAAREEMKQLDAKMLPMLAEDIEAAAAQEKAAKVKELNAAAVERLQTRFDEMRAYVRAIEGRLKEVRTNLGFAEKMAGESPDGEDGEDRMAA